MQVNGIVKRDACTSQRCAACGMLTEQSSCDELWRVLSASPVADIRLCIAKEDSGAEYTFLFTGSLGASATQGDHLQVGVTILTDRSSPSDCNLLHMTWKAQRKGCKVILNRCHKQSLHQKSEPMIGLTFV